MKILNNKFEDYLNEYNYSNLHKELLPINNLIHQNYKIVKNEKLSNINTSNKKILNLNNFIYYGPSGVGKYTQVLNMISKYSPSCLKYERKIRFCS